MIERIVADGTPRDQFVARSGGAPLGMLACMDVPEQGQGDGELASQALLQVSLRGHVLLLLASGGARRAVKRLSCDQLIGASAVQVVVEGMIPLPSPPPCGGKESEPFAA